MTYVEDNYADDAPPSPTTVGGDTDLQGLTERIEEAADRIEDAADRIERSDAADAADGSTGSATP